MPALGLVAPLIHENIRLWQCERPSAAPKEGVTVRTQAR